MDPVTQSPRAASASAVSPEFASGWIAICTAPLDWLARITACVVPVTCLMRGDVRMSVATAIVLGFVDGGSKLWGSCTSRSFIAESAGLKISSAFRVRVVPWRDVSAIQTWHHFNRLDYVAIHYQSAGRLEVATCFDQDGADDLAEFVRACAACVRANSRPLSITRAGLCERSVYSRLFWRFSVDIAIATLVGLTLGLVRQGFLLGVLSAGLSTLAAATRWSFHTSTLVFQNGLWCSQNAQARPLRTIPRSLRLWTRGLTDD